MKRLILIVALVTLIPATTLGSGKPHSKWDPKTMFPSDRPLPIAVEQLPVVKPHFRIDIVHDTGVFTIVPQIAYGNVNPKTFMKENWQKYISYSHEALKWLEDHKLGRSVRDEWNIKINWWLKEFWPEKAKSPEATFKPAKPKQAKAKKLVTKKLKK